MSAPRRLSVLALAAALAGCATEIKGPIIGRLSDGSPAIGEATARMDGDGSFWVELAAGSRCEGPYDALARDLVITAAVTCSDGRTGTAVITRQPSLQSGKAEVTLTDGTSGQFVFGGLTMDEAFPPLPPA